MKTGMNRSESCFCSIALLGAYLVIKKYDTQKANALLSVQEKTVFI